MAVNSGKNHKVLQAAKTQLDKSRLPEPRGLDALAALKKPEAVTAEALVKSNAATWKTQPARYVGESELSPQAVEATKDESLLDRDTPTQKYLREQALNNPELAALTHRDDGVISETMNRIYASNQILNLDPSTPKNEVGNLSFVNPYTASEMNQMQTQFPTQVINFDDHTAANKLYLSDDGAMAEQFKELAEEYPQFVPESTALSASNPHTPWLHAAVGQEGGFGYTIGCRYPSTNAFQSLFTMANASDLYKAALSTASGKGIYGQTIKQGMATFYPAWIAVDAISGAKAMLLALKKYCEDQTIRNIDFSELLLQSCLKTDLSRTTMTNNHGINASNFRKDSMSNIEVSGYVAKLSIELSEYHNTLLAESTILSDKILVIDSGIYTDPAEYNKAIITRNELKIKLDELIGLTRLTRDAVAQLIPAHSFLLTSYQMGWGSDETDCAYITMEYDGVDDVTVILNIAVPEGLQETINERKEALTSELEAILPSDVAVNESMMESLKALLLKEFISGRKSACTQPQKHMLQQGFGMQAFGQFGGSPDRAQMFATHQVQMPRYLQRAVQESQSGSNAFPVEEFLQYGMLANQQPTHHVYSQKHFLKQGEDSQQSSQVVQMNPSHPDHDDQAAEAARERMTQPQTWLNTSEYRTRKAQLTQAQQNQTPSLDGKGR